MKMAAALLRLIVVVTSQISLSQTVHGSDTSTLIKVAVQVPVIGCRTETMALEDIPAPTNKVVEIAELVPSSKISSNSDQMLRIRAMRELAYYVAKDKQRDMVLAPRGWDCLYRTGTAGGSFSIAPPPAPQTAASGKRGKSVWPNPFGPGVYYDYFNSDGSGSMMVGRLIAVVFPHLSPTGNRWNDYEGGIRSESYPNDKVLSRYKYPKPQEPGGRFELAWFVTPAHLEGVGTILDNFIRNDAPITSKFHVLLPDGNERYPNTVVSVFSVRMTPGKENLTKFIMSMDFCPIVCDED
jgi:hypothetical protein